MPAYLIAQVTVHDPVGYEKYLAGFADIFAPYKGRVLVATEAVEVMEGAWPKTRTVVLEFPSMDDAKRWYKSPAYQALVQHRFKAATANLVFAEGWEPPKG